MEPAKHIWIAELLQSTLVQSADAPSALRLPNGELVHRLRLYGTVVSEEAVIDDGTGSILVRSFEQPQQLAIGDPVLVIGKPRIYNEQPYVVGDILKKTDPLWLTIAQKQRPLKKHESPIDIVKQLDQGEGADYDAVVTKIGQNGEETITHLLAVGELFETRPGKLKVLE